MKYWLLILIAAVLEVGWVVGLKHATTWYEWIFTFSAVILTFYLLLKATEKLPVGTAYAVFVGLGTAGTVITDMLLFDAPFEFKKIALIGTLLIGVIGLKLLTPNKEAL